jgi:hypothetical protein
MTGRGLHGGDANPEARNRPNSRGAGPILNIDMDETRVSIKSLRED